MPPSDTVIASQSALESIVESARTKKRWDKYDTRWLIAASVSRSVLHKFWTRKPIRHDNFDNICKAIEIEPKGVLDNNANDSNTSSMDIEFVSYDEYWVGREQLINDLSAKLNGSVRVLLLLGLTGIGKTALAERLVQELRGKWLELRDNLEKPEYSPDFASVAKQWLERLGEVILQEDSTPEKLFERLISCLCQYLGQKKSMKRGLM